MEYSVIRTDRRTMALEITPEGDLLVRAPIRVTAAEIERFVGEHSDWVARHLARMEARRRPPLAAEEEKELRLRAKADLPARTAAWAARMGIEYRGVKITSARHRFGSCNVNGGICYSFLLMQFPDEVIDYVVVHELAHRKEMNHSKRFYAIIAQYLPDYRRRVALLRSLPRSL